MVTLILSFMKRIFFLCFILFLSPSAMLNLFLSFPFGTKPLNYQHWVVEFEFKIEGQGSKVFGDGFAFWVTKERAETGLDFQDPLFVHSFFSSSISFSFKSNQIEQSTLRCCWQFDKIIMETGPVFGNRDMFSGLGIFFDTYPNSRHKYTFPYVTAMIGDGSTPYSNDDDNEVNKAGGCEVG